MIEELLLPFQFPFMQSAFVIAALISAPAAILSCFLVLKGWSLIGDAISHAVLPGIVLAYLVQAPLLIGAFIAGMICAITTGFLHENSRLKQDTVMGVVFAGMFGFGLVLYSRIETDIHLDHILFGNILGVGASDIATSAGIAIFVLICLLGRWRDLLLHAFDPSHARAVGLRVGLLHYGLLGLISITVVAALKAVGIILCIALLIAPGAIAFLLARRFGIMLITAVAVTLLASLGGIYLSFWIDSAPAPTIVVLLTLLFIAAFLYRTVQTRAATTRVT